MGLVKGHGNGRGSSRIEIARAGTIPRGIAAEPMTPMQLHRLKKKLGAEMAKLDCANSVDRLPDAIQPFLSAAIEWRDQCAVDLAVQQGGGEVGTGAQAILSHAMLQLAMSRFLSHSGMMTLDSGMMRSASVMADSHRQNMLAAHELIVREALARAAMRERPDATLAEKLAEPLPEPEQQH